MQYALGDRPGIAASFIWDGNGKLVKRDKLFDKVRAMPRDSNLWLQCRLRACCRQGHLASMSDISIPSSPALICLTDMNVCSIMVLPMRPISAIAFHDCFAPAPFPGRLPFKGGVVPLCFSPGEQASSLHRPLRRTERRSRHQVIRMPLLIVPNCSSQRFFDKMPKSMPKLAKTIETIPAGQPRGSSKKAPNLETIRPATGATQAEDLRTANSHRTGVSFSLACAKSTVYSPIAHLSQSSSRSPVVRSRSIAERILWTPNEVSVHPSAPPGADLRQN